jgi:hypothetical protein
VYSWRLCVNAIGSIVRMSVANSSNNNYLSIACSRGQLDAVCLILANASNFHINNHRSNSNGISIGSADPFLIEPGETKSPFLLAVTADTVDEDLIAVLLWHKYRQSCRYLCERGPVNTLDSDSFSAAGILVPMCAVSTQPFGEYYDEHGYSAMYHAIVGNNVRVVAILLYFDVYTAFHLVHDKHTPTKDGENQSELNAIELAQLCNHVRIHRYLLHYLHSNVDKFDSKYSNTIHQATISSKRKKCFPCDNMFTSTDKSSRHRTKQSYSFLSERCVLLGVDCMELLTFRVTMASVMILYICLFVFALSLSGWRMAGLLCVAIASNLLAGTFAWSMYDCEPGLISSPCVHTLSKNGIDIENGDGGDSGKVGEDTRYSYLSALQRIVDSALHKHSRPLTSRTSTHSIQSKYDACSPKQYVCHLCHCYRPLRAAHSHHSQRCVPLYDHFCAFLWADIGRDNYGSFVCLVALVATIAVPLFLVCMYVYWNDYYMETVEPLGLLIMNQLREQLPANLRAEGAIGTIPGARSAWFQIDLVRLMNDVAAVIATKMKFPTSPESSAIIVYNLSVFTTKCVMLWGLMLFSVWMGSLCFFMWIILVFHVYLMSKGITSMEYQTVFTNKHSRGQQDTGEHASLRSSNSRLSYLSTTGNQFSRGSMLANIIDRMSPSILVDVYEHAHMLELIQESASCTNGSQPYLCLQLLLVILRICRQVFRFATVEIKSKVASCGYFIKHGNKWQDIATSLGITRNKTNRDV